MSNINRRDFINGSAAAIAGSLAGGLPALTQAAEPSPYPPGLTGLRGSHPGSNTIAHQRAWNGEFRVADARPTDEHYDLVVVGAGLSGLAAAVPFSGNNMGPIKKYSYSITMTILAGTPSVMNTILTAKR